MRLSSGTAYARGPVTKKELIDEVPWVAAAVGAVLLTTDVLVMRGYDHRFHLNLFLTLYPVPAVVVVALLAGALAAGGFVYACVGERQIPAHRGRRRTGAAAAGAAGLAWLWWSWD